MTHPPPSSRRTFLGIALVVTVITLAGAAMTGLSHLLPEKIGRAHV
mgnify:CR=1 FL=1